MSRRLLPLALLLLAACGQTGPLRLPEPEAPPPPAAAPAEEAPKDKPATPATP
jgi:predicted small lipoprotein YifL